MHDQRTAARFWSKVRFPAGDGCWIWVGATSPNGYGNFQPVAGSATGAHRVAYMLVRGPVPEDLVLDHLCRVRNCVNPAHLEPVTTRENLRRGTWPEVLVKTHCKRGHEFTPENTRLRYRENRAKPERVCRTCAKESRVLLKERCAAEGHPQRSTGAPFCRCGCRRK